MNYELIEVLEKFRNRDNAYRFTKYQAGEIKRRGLTDVLSVRMYQRNGLWRVCLYRVSK